MGVNIEGKGSLLYDRDSGLVVGFLDANGREQGFPNGFYSNPVPTTAQVGGIPAGSTFANRSVAQMFDALLYPYQAPGFTSFGLSGVGSPVEVGTSFPATETFVWATSNPSNVGTNSISLNDGGTPIANTLPNTGTSTQTLGAAIVRTSAGTRTFGIAATDLASTPFYGSATITWLWRLYYGASASATLNAAAIAGLASSTLAGGYAGSYSMAAGGYKFICLADAVGGQINTVKDASTGFSVPMATGTFTDGGGFGYEKVSVTNGQGVTTNVRVYRTLNALGGAITLQVT